MTGITDVSLVVFVRKTTPEIQYLKTSIDDLQSLKTEATIDCPQQAADIDYWKTEASPP